MYKARLVSMGTLVGLLGVQAAFAASPEPKLSFGAAYGMLLESETTGASASILKAVRFMKKQAATATPETKKGLIASITELQKLASLVAKGALVSAGKLSGPFARAHVALVKHYVAAGKAAWGKKDVKATGKAISAAVQDISGATKWSRYKLDSAAKSSLRKAKTLGKSLESGKKASAADVTKTLTTLGELAGKLAKKAAVMK